ncbi:hypothetical protein SDC9_108054 [bioreactor metagenome]|uniref:Uncharacterized protein n=1 Tax=bioreactor metagenome TaxID=1076179 RepID=A0A645B820_9ZZZZ
MGEISDLDNLVSIGQESQLSIHPGSGFFWYLKRRHLFNAAFITGKGNECLVATPCITDGIQPELIT